MRPAFFFLFRRTIFSLFRPLHSAFELFRRRYEVSVGTAKKFRIFTDLMAKPEVESLVCATEAGREGWLDRDV